ncbi:uncharacterized protein LOC118216668 isoform X1 [Anguilla anguilla]|uniref:uncharacterized protein LOC118216668 isoform X1 n=1 Tax=Anguilla anguilla TaxID=7936 RepID=UPI0015AB1FFC|nr:uncharacterized protein LOC118216668 isoform X1 [Anguilla anguilla]XP_035253945.1 uncharacterized protein LOC118216668 isoform X1 [Anguilla anguilla]
MDAYAVVMLTEEDVMAVVPKSWCTDQGCYWPPYASNARIQRAVQSHEMPSSTWYLHKARVLAVKSSYEKATAWLRHTEDAPNPATEDGIKYNLKRTKRSVSECLPNASNGPMAATDFQAVVLQRLAELDAAVAELRAQVEYNTLLLQNLQGGQNPGGGGRGGGGGVGGEEYALPADLPLPLQSKQQLGQLEKRLAEDPGLQEYLVCSLASKGGRSVRNAVRAMVPCLVSNTVARGLNWTGAGEKLAFRDLILRKVLNRGVRRNLATKDATDEEIQREVSVFLRGASDREGGRRERMLRSVAREMVSSLHQ